MPIPLPTYGRYCGNGRGDGGSNDAVQIANDLGIEPTVDNLIIYHGAPVDGLDMACLLHDLGGIGDDILQDILTDIEFAVNAGLAASSAASIYGVLYGYAAAVLSLTTFTLWHTVVGALELVSDAASWAADFAGNAFDWIGDVVGDIGATIGDAADAFWDWGQDFASDAWDFVSGVFDSFWDAASDFFGGIGDFFGSLFDEIGSWFGYYWPIALDLDGDGVELTSIHNGVSVDANGDGVLDQMAWVSADDGILAYDANGDGLASLDEISFVQWIDGAATDLAGLAYFDSNGDGLLDANDAAFDGFMVWRDLNGDGISQAGETMTLTAAGVASINLALNGVHFEADGSEVHNTTQVIMADGTVMEAWDVALGVMDRNGGDVASTAANDDDAFDAAAQLAVALASGDDTGEMPASASDLSMADSDFLRRLVA